MALDTTLPKDPVTAQQTLEALVIKDQDERICRYPTCSELRKTPEKGGKPPAYCGNPLHTAQRSLRARDYIGDLAKGLSPVSLETEQPANTITVQSLRDLTLARLEQFQNHLGLYVAAIRELSDPDIAAAQIEAAHYRADAQIASIQEAIKTEQSFRKSAENLRDTAQAARDAAQQDAQAARGETALALAKLKQSEERALLQQEKHEQEIAKIEQEHASSIEAIRVETQKQIEAIHAQANKDIALAQEKTVVAQEETSAANLRAHDAETKAKIEIASAEQRMKEAQVSLKREQDEVTQLRQERDTQASEARRQSEDSGKEIQRLRTELTETTLDARRRAEDDRKEIQQLREKLDRAIQRADDLARSNDTLRSQLIQIQTEREKTNQQ